MFDMKNLNRLKKLDENAPDSMKAFWAFDKAVFAGGALTVQQKQLIAVAVALTTQCPYCIELHNKAARDAGATDAQLAEAALVAAAMRAGAAGTHFTPLFRAFWDRMGGVYREPEREKHRRGAVRHVLCIFPLRFRLLLLS